MAAMGGGKEAREVSAAHEERGGGTVPPPPPPSPILLKGIVIGNGHLDPARQSGSEIDTLVRAGMWSKNGPEHQRLQPLLDACQSAVAKDAISRAEYEECDAIPSHIVHSTIQRYVRRAGMREKKKKTKKRRDVLTHIYTHAESVGQNIASIYTTSALPTSRQPVA